MNRKTTHGLMITAILVAVFIAAALTPVKSYKKNAPAGAPVTVASAVLSDGSVMITDNEVPLAETPFETDINMTAWLIVVTIAAVISGVVIYVDCKTSTF